MPRLTARAVDAAKPAAKRQEIPDAALPGLVLVVQPTGRKSFVLRYRHAGRSRRLALGRYPVTSLADAREAARAALAEIDAGRDPAAAREEGRRAAEAEAAAAEAAQRDTVENVVADYLRRDASKNRSARETERIMRAYVLPAWAGRSIHDIGRRDVLDLLDGLVDRGVATTANRTLAAVRRMFNWCAERDILAASPAAGVKAPAKERARDRVLSDDEVRWLWTGAETVGWPFGPLARFLLLTGQRVGEAAGMTEDEIAGDVWQLPAERTKNGRPHAVPLSPAARAILEEAPFIAPPPGGERLIFTTTGAAPVSGWTRARNRLHAAMEAAAAQERGEPVEVPRWTLHDLRRTCATGLARLGTPVHVTEAVLNHISGTRAGIVSVYQLHDYADEKRRSLEAWAVEVERIAAGRPAGKVVKLR